MKKVTMQDIADLLNLSKNSVSQALRNKGGVSEGTRRKILKTAEKMGYHYKGRLSVSSVLQSRNFALFASDFALSHRSFFGEILRNIENELTEKGMSLSVFNISADQADINTLPDGFDVKDYQGLFILSHINQCYLQMLLDLHVPTVMIDHHDPNLPIDCVLSQNKTGAYLATEYLIGLGHQNIGFMGDIDWSPSYEERWEGYKKALRHNHIRYQEEFILTKVKEERSSLYRTLDNFSEKLENWPTAWLCTNSGLGFILISYFQSIGFNIPENISVCCFDDTEFTLLSNPRITTVAVKLDDMGHQAVVLMGRRLEHPEAPPIHILLPTHLIERESTGHPQNKD